MRSLLFRHQTFCVAAEGAILAQAILFQGLLVKVVGFQVCCQCSDCVILRSCSLSLTAQRFGQRRLLCVARCMCIAFSGKVDQDESWMIGKVAGALAIAVIFAVIGFATFSVEGGCCGCAFASSSRTSGQWQHSKKTKEEASQFAPATNFCRMAGV